MRRRTRGTLPYVLAGLASLMSGRQLGAETFDDVFQDWKNLYLQESRAVRAVTLSIGHMRLSLVSGQAAYVFAGREVVGIFFRGEGGLEFSTTDRTEFPAVRWNVRHNTSLKLTETSSTLTLSDRFTEVLWLAWGERLPELHGESAGRILDEPFVKHRGRFGRLHSRSTEIAFPHWRFSTPDRRLVHAEIAGGDVDFGYGFDDGRDGSEELVAVKPADGKPGAEPRDLDVIALSMMPVGRDRRDPTIPLVFMSHVDLAITAAGGKNVAISATETFSATSAEVSALRLGLYNERRRSEGGAQRQLSLPLLLKGVYDESGRPLPFRHQSDEVIVGLPTPLKPGLRTKLRFDIEGEILHSPEGNDYWELDDEAWFPQPVWAEQNYTASCVVRVKKPFTPLASGTTISRTVDGEFNVLVTQADKPIRGLTVLAGKYHLSEETRNGVTIRLASYGQKNPLSAVTLTKLVRGIVDYYEGFLGPFPFRELNVVGKSEAFFIMSSRPGFLLVNQAVFGPRLGADRVWFKGGIGRRTARTIAEQYWGQAVKAPSPAEWWVTEGFAEVSAALAMRDLRRPAEFEEIRKEWQSAAKKVAGVAPIPLAVRLHPTLDQAPRQDLPNAKGAWLLDVIRRELGERSFLVFLSSCQATSSWKFGGGAKTVQAVLEAVSKKPWGPFFEANYWGTGMPEEAGLAAYERAATVAAPPTPRRAPEEPGTVSGSDVDFALKRLLELRDAGFEEDLLIAWFQKNRPRRALTAEEMILWKKTGVPPGVIREAMK